MKRLVPVYVFVLAALLLSFTPLAASAQAGSTTIYVVQTGDTAYVVATRYCMSVQELYNLNGAAVSNPNPLSVGMQLRVVNHCGGSSGGYGCYGTGNIYDHGPRPHAQGYLNGNIYTVVRGDTSFSIAQRFGISTSALAQANGINPWYIKAGQRLVIPGYGGGYCQPTPVPCYPYYPGYACPPVSPTYPIVVPITPVPTVPTSVAPRITVTAPAPNAALPPTFTVTGTGQGLFEGSLVVRVVTSTGAVLAEVPATLQGTNVGAGGAGTFSVQIITNLPQPTPGFIVVSATQTPAAQPVYVPVTFSAGSSQNITYYEYSGQQCKVAIVVGAPYYSQVGGAQLGTFAGVGTYTATRGAKYNSQLWYYITEVPGSTPAVWVPHTSVALLSPACAWG